MVRRLGADGAASGWPGWTGMDRVDGPGWSGFPIVAAVQMRTEEEVFAQKSNDLIMSIRK